MENGSLEALRNCVTDVFIYVFINNVLDALNF